MRPGYGIRLPEVTELLATATPDGVEHAAWLDGTLPLRISSYLGPCELPDPVVTSIRCIVRVDGRIVICDTPSGSDPWPGGRREHGETHWETARREVHEETGWIIEPGAFEMLGWLHIECLREMPADHPYPHPDFLQVVYSTTASERDPGDGGEWSNADGWVLASRLVGHDDLGSIGLPSSSKPYLDELAARGHV